jgi:hypothetical protein
MGQQTQQQPVASKEPEFEPDDNTIWLCLPCTGIEAAMQMRLTEKYGRVVGRIATSWDAHRLSDRHTIVPVYVDNYEPVRDEATGKIRKRRVSGQDRDPLNIKIGKPIRCRDIASPDDETGAAAVQIRNLLDEGGRTKKGLLGLLTDATLKTDARGRTASSGIRARYRDDTHILTLTDL